MEIQQHDGVGGGSSGIPTGLHQALREEGDVSWEGEGGARAYVWLPSLPPTIYRAKGEGEAQPLPLPPRKGCGQGWERRGRRTNMGPKAHIL